MGDYYPAFLDLRDKECVVVGGGRIAERKVLSLISSGATVKIISPTLTNNLKKYKKKGIIKHIERKYKKGDLKNAFLVIIATSDSELNKKIASEANYLVNVVDMPHLSNFIVPSVMKNGPLKIAISTSGSSPAMAKTIRKELQELYNKDFGKFLNFLKSLRQDLLKKISDKKKRENLFKKFATDEIIKTLRKNGFKEAKTKIIKEIDLNL